MANRRSYGTGSLYPSENGQTWVGHWRSNGRQVKRIVGPIRQPGSRQGLTRTQAEATLRELIAETEVRPRVGERLDLDQVSRRYRLHLERKVRKRSTVQNVESEVRVHLVPFFGEKALDAITPEDVIVSVTPRIRFKSGRPDPHPHPRVRDVLALPTRIRRTRGVCPLLNDSNH
jgi:integrase